MFGFFLNTGKPFSIASHSSNLFDFNVIYYHGCAIHLPLSKNVFPMDFLNQYLYCGGGSVAKSALVSIYSHLLKKSQV